MGAGLVGAVAGVVGGLVQALAPPPPRMALLGLLALAVAVRELGIARFPIPENRRLVPEEVQHRGPLWGAAQFGFEMGTGVRTYSPTALPHLMLAALVLAVPFGAVPAAALGFAAGRWTMAVAALRYGPAGEWTATWDAHRRWLVPMLTVATLLSLSVALTPIRW
ncbi:hypothetical protein ACQEU5_03135 [Marinactinospora thermotolerans]|uniref:Uncharacterized protein n=1 Tax=Marinactinospora thermotolerans DSM 45154 TaxID=1122192 RepID=A0A1T4LHY7_9ACTN|nr:hypothetical protein [Marinactinospora thermotolerans]SJZ54211.1 hypothetical protein SAMN02745673_00681 [Marinactinospora thermotolerans DSM 45154]